MSFPLQFVDEAEERKRDLNAWLEEHGYKTFKWAEESETEINRCWQFIREGTFFESKTGTECYFLGIYYNESEQADLAKVYFQRGRKLGHPRCIYNIGLIYEEREKFSAAHACFLEAHKLGHPVDDFRLARAYQEKKKYLQMKRCYHQFMVEHQSSDAAWNLALYYESIGKDLKYEKYMSLALQYGEMGAIPHLYQHYVKGNRLKSIKAFIFAARYKQELLKLGLAPSVLWKTRKFTSDLVHSLFCLTKAEISTLSPAHPLLKEQALELLQIHLYSPSSYFTSYLSKDVFIHVLVPYLHH